MVLSLSFKSSHHSILVVGAILLSLSLSCHYFILSQFMFSSDQSLDLASLAEVL